MNVIELRNQLGKVQKTVHKLPALALGSIDIALNVDQQWNISTKVSPARDKGKGKGVISYENIWTKETHEMAGKVAARVTDLHLTLEGRLLQASACIQKDILDADYGGIIAFWRSGNGWIAPRIHDSCCYSGSMVFFIDSFVQLNSLAPFICCDNLAEMPSDYQTDFIGKLWP